MANTINGARRMIVKSAVVDSAESVGGDLRIGEGEYSDLMHNVEMQVQTVLEEEGLLEY